MTDLMRREPYGGVQPLRNAMNRLFEDSFVRSSETASALSPALDMYETDNEFIIKLEVAGVEPGDIDIQVVGDSLTIRGEIKSETESEGRHYLWRERRCGRFIRNLQLPDSADTGNVEAEFSKGILQLTVAKREETKPKSIQIKIK
jgi:HSP20 family protein